ncbi:MAG: response regulator transcription factor [Chthoniobacterales bacterium]|nr:response regulator transcription factor [Chthoniobacterales bacterium]
MTVANALGVLIKAAGWNPLVFYAAATALSHLGSNVALPAAAIVDIHLPDMNGLVLSQKLREAFGPQPPIIVLSGDTSTETIRSLSHVGATYFFSKPVNGKHLIEKIRTLLEENTGNPNDETRNPNE